MEEGAGKGEKKEKDKKGPSFLSPKRLIVGSLTLPWTIAKMTWNLARETYVSMGCLPGERLKHKVSMKYFLGRSWAFGLFPLFALVNVNTRSIAWWIEFAGACAPIISVVVSVWIVNTIAASRQNG